MIYDLVKEMLVDNV